jgi:hypothetical protein
MTMKESRRELKDELDELEAELRGQEPGPFEAGEEFGQPLRVRGMIIPVHIDRDAVRSIRSAARVDGVTPSEFIRRTAIEAAQARDPSAHEGLPFNTGSRTGDDGED